MNWSCDTMTSGEPPVLMQSEQVDRKNVVVFNVKLNMDSDVDLDWNSEQIDDDFIDKSDNEVSHNVN